MIFIVVGSTGQVGSALVSALAKRELQYVSFSSAQLDIVSRSQVKLVLGEVRKNNLGERIVLVNCAAFTDVELAQRQPDKAWDVNVFGVQNLASIAKELDLEFVQLSTDYVFDGSQQYPYETTDPCAPVQNYGRTKLGAEIFLQTLYPASLIVRTSMVFTGKGWENDFINRVLVKFSNAESFGVRSDQISSCMYVEDLTQGLLDLVIPAPRGGLVHMVNEGICTRFEFAYEVGRLTNQDLKLLMPVEFNDENSLYAPRPKYSVLGASSLQDYGLAPLPNWRLALKKALS